FGVRDPHGFRPLVLGRTDGGWVLASETAALDIVGAHFVRDVEPGELVAIDANGVRSIRYAEPTPKLCLFEFVYIARPDTQLYGQSVSSPPYKWPCFYGLDTGKRSDLLAADMSVGEIKDFLSVDSLAYLDLDRLISATGAGAEGFCT